ncbi:MAG: DctP family TRAP transporter solute-binding subunit [Proteobacteria bacterium]|nr:DctP family TRAP transporter solute-binding subunit [Pseudomonadota bacterium]
MRAFKWMVITLFFVCFIYSGVIWSQEIKLGVVTRPGAAQNICADKFKELLESRSAYKVKIYDSGSLGTEVKILKQIQANKVHMGIITSGPFDQFLPEVRVIDYPYLFKSYEQVDSVLEGPLGKELLKTLEKAGFKGLAFSENGFRHLTNSKRTVYSVVDVTGLRIRVMESALHKALWQLFGADPVPIGDLNELVKDLQSGAVDGQENPLSAIWLDDFYKGQKYLSLTGHVYSSHIGVAGLKWYQDLPEKDQKLIRQSMEEAARYERRWSRENSANFLAKIKAAGIIVDEKPDVTSFRNKASQMEENKIFRGKEVQALLQKFLKATAGAEK